MLVPDEDLIERDGNEMLWEGGSPKRMKTRLRGTHKAVCFWGETKRAHEYAARAPVMVPEMTSSDLFKSARAASGRPQLATWRWYDDGRSAVTGVDDTNRSPEVCACEER